MFKKDQTGTTALTTPSRKRLLAYALPEWTNRGSHTINDAEFDLFNEPLQARASFLDFDGVVTFAGAFEVPGQNQCVAPSDLDRREREFHTGTEQGKTFIFLFSNLLGYESHMDSRIDLARRISAKNEIQFFNIEQALADLAPHVPEFRDYFRKHGTGYVQFYIPEEVLSRITVICADAERNVYGLALRDRIFLLPCTQPETHRQAVDTALDAIKAVLAYQRRISTALPAWASTFLFTEEQKLETEAKKVRDQLGELESQIASYGEFKGVLCYQSDPLVALVAKLLACFCGIQLTIDDKHIEDATVRDEVDKIAAVVEIKGVKGDFKRGNVNQIDSHRERLGVPPDTPGILIMNTLMEAASLKEKDQAPHPDIIKKAVSDRVVLLRTLDLLQIADGVEQGWFSKDAVRGVLLTQAGWARVRDQKLEVVVP